MSWGVFPLLLVVVAVALLVFRRRPLVWLVAASLLAYILIVRITPLAAAYIYVTYFEILFTPARNFAYFLHFTAGALIWVLARETHRRGGLAAGAALMTGAAVICAWWPNGIDRYPDLLFLPAAVALVYTCYSLTTQHESHRSSDVIVRYSMRGRAPLAVAVPLGTVSMGLLVAWVATASTAPIVNVRWREDVNAVRRAQLERQFALVADKDIGQRTWAYELLDRSRRNVAAIVQSAEVEDTNDIDRASYSVSESASPGRQLGWPGARIPFLDTPTNIRRVVLALAIAAFLIVCGRERRPMPVVAGLLLTMLAATGAHPEMSPITAPKTPDTPGALRATVQCRQDSGHLSCPPPGELIEWVSTHVPVDRLFVSDAFNQYPLMMFVPQQSVGWTGLAGNFLNPDELFGPYMQWQRAAQRRGLGQPFFNDQETSADRRHFVTALGVSYVMVDPPYHDLMERQLGGDPLFERLYDRENWAVYRVVAPR